MNTRETEIAFENSLRFDESRIRAAAVYCSDGRFGEFFDDFLQNALKLPRYDRLAVPGGAACLAGHFLVHREEEAMIEQLRFLIKVHGIERVVLIAHQDCAFYTQLLKTPFFQLESRQREDMQAATGRVRSFAPNLQVESFFARKCENGTIQFTIMEP